VPKLLDTPGTLRTPAPRLGEHTVSVLNALGVSAQQVEQLRHDGVIKWPED